jgi:hypothetical protein
VGNQAWTILALLAGHDALGHERWLLAAERVAAFVLDPDNGLENPNGFGGYRLRAGLTGVSTEHNLDLNAAFERLARVQPTSAGRVSAEQAHLAGRNRGRRAVVHHPPGSVSAGRALPSLPR